MGSRRDEIQEINKDLQKINEDLKNFLNNDNIQRRKIEEILGILKEYRVDELKEELGEMEDERVLRIWELLKPTFTAMCWRFGTMSPSRRVKAYELHQQIVKISAILERANSL